MNSRDRIVKFLAGERVDRLPLMPITMMFAADVIGAKYGDYARDHRVLVEAQIRTAERYGFDHVSCISDPAREAADCGASIVYFDNQPPAIDESNPRIKEKSDLTRMKVPSPTSGERMLDRIRAAELFRRRAGEQTLIEGWVEGPCAEAADLRGINNLMLDLIDDEEFVEDLFDFTTRLGLRFAQAQIEAGADLIGVGDAAASLVGPALYEQFVLPCEMQLIDGIHAMGGLVRLHICGNTSAILKYLPQLGCEIVDLDYMVPISEGREILGPDQVLLGNIDPVGVLRFGSPDDVASGIARCHREAGRRYIVGAGCEIPRDTPAENVEALAHYARNHN